MRIQTIEGMKIGGLIMTGVGIGVVALLWELAGHKVAVCGVIPALIGLAMLAYVLLSRRAGRVAGRGYSAALAARASTAAIFAISASGNPWRSLKYDGLL